MNAVRAFAFLASTAFIGVGCEAQRSLRLSGSIVTSHAGADVRVLDLASGREHKVFDWGFATRAPAGIGGIVDSSIIVAHEDGRGGWDVVRVRLDGRAAVPLWKGAHPTVVDAGRSVVFYAERSEADSVAALMLAHPGSEVRPRLLGYVGRVGGAEDPWWRYCPAPVEMDSGFVAVVGTDRALWKIDVATGQWRRLGHAGLVPEFWQATRKTLVCWRGPGSRERVGLDTRTGQVRGIPRLSGMAGYAPSRAMNVALAVLPGPPRLMRDSWDLKLYDWDRGTVRTVVADTYFAGRALWLEK